MRAAALRCAWPRCCVIALVVACTEDPAETSATSDAGETTGAPHVHVHAAEQDAAVVGDAGSSHSHHVRDLATEPCNTQTWRELGVDLRECQLAGEDLEDESLRHVNLSDADLSAASLKDADLFNAKLVRAKLGFATLDGATLVGVDFTNADLTGATLRAADLATAVLTGALLEGTLTDAETTCPDGSAGPCW